MPIEIIDVSITNQNDTRSILQDFLFNKTMNKYTSFNYVFDQQHHISIDIPSADFMFTDIAMILFADYLFPWVDLKYKKRIKRLLLLSLICQFMQNTNISIIISHFQLFFDFFQQFLNLDLQHKFDFLPHSSIHTNFRTHTINNGQDIHARILNIDPRINFYIDIIIANYFENIITLMYFKHHSDELFLYKNYCDICFNISKNINSQTHLDGSIGVLPFDQYSNSNFIDQHFLKLQKYENDVLSVINSILLFLNYLKSFNVNTLNITYDDIDQLF
jgi:hypothetical protein